MKKIVWAIAICVLGLGVVSYVWFARAEHGDLSQDTHSPSSDLGQYFFSVPVEECKVTRLPSIALEVEGYTVWAVLDLGLKGNFTFHDTFLSQLKKKTYVSSTKRYDFRGNEYERKIYEIPKVQIGPFSFYDYYGLEEGSDFRRNSAITHKAQEASQEEAKVGWQLFQETNLFLDLGHKQIGFCDSFATLEKEGYAADTFVQVPFDVERGLIEIQGMTPEGPLLCTLDTGMTWNVLHKEIEDGTPLEEFALNPKNIISLPSLTIAGKETGPLSFHQIPLKLPIKIEAALGMEFFRAYRVFIDFKEKQIYIAPGDSLSASQ